MDNTCSNCKHYDEPLCRRDTPQIKAQVAAGHWPEVKRTDWCGKHEPKVA